jgi:small subunit ribosomal protein S13
MVDKKTTKYIVRLKNTDLNGSKPTFYALTKIKGVGVMYSNAVLNVTGIDTQKKIGDCSDTEVKKLNEVLDNPSKFNIPSWLFNRRFDPVTGEDKHLYVSDLEFAQSNDIKQQQKIKSNRGMRHHFRLPLRGQRTKSNFRRSKVAGKGSLGVKRKKK